MNGAEFIRRVRKQGRKAGVDVRVDPTRGKGGHQTLYYGDRHTVVPTGEIKKGLLHALCRDLGLRPTDI